MTVVKPHSVTQTEQATDPPSVAKVACVNKPEVEIAKAKLDNALAAMAVACALTNKERAAIEAEEQEEKRKGATVDATIDATNNQKLVATTVPCSVPKKKRAVVELADFNLPEVAPEELS